MFDDDWNQKRILAFTSYGMVGTASESLFSHYAVDEALIRVRKINYFGG